MRIISWLSSVRSTLRRRTVRANRGLRIHRHVSAIESLETRELLAATISYSNVTREVLINGTASADSVTVNAVSATTTAVSVVTLGQSIEQTFLNSDVNRFIFLGGAGDDSLLETTNLPIDIYGGDGNDTLAVSGDANFVLTNTLLTGHGSDTLAEIEIVKITGGMSANTINASAASIKLIAFGGGGNDTITGSLLNDEIDGGDGADTLNGFGGNDTVTGGNGNDWVMGGSGTDFCDGGAGDDKVEGLGGSNDTVRGGLGNDTLDGGIGTGDMVSEVGDANFTLTTTTLTGLGTDTLLNIKAAQFVGGAGASKIDVSAFGLPTTLTGGAGNDTLIGSMANDLLVETADVNFTLSDTQLTGLGTDSLSGIDRIILTGGAGANLINAGATTKPVTLTGGDGNDTLIGGTATDLVDGGNGNDRMTGGSGVNTLLGGAGTDRLVEAADANLVLSNGSLIALQTELINSFEEAELTGGVSANKLSVSGNFIGPVTLNGGDGNDTLIGTPLNDVLNGGNGDDSLNGVGGDNTLDGGAGNDILFGGAGNDSIFGNAGNDIASGLDGNDTIIGGIGNDTLQGQYGNDSLDGSAGADIVLGSYGNDTVVGGTGRDLVIGGYGSDSVHGGNDDDLVIGGTSKYDNNLTTLAQIVVAWNGAATYASRVTQLSNTATAYFLKSMTQYTDVASVYDDYSKDTLLGGLGQDYFLRPGDPNGTTIDTTSDRVAASEQMNVSVYGSESAGFFPVNMTKPGYLATLNDPTFGTPITRITNDPGTPLTLNVNTGGTASIVWSGAVRTRYVTDSMWNVDGSMLMLRSYDPALTYHVVLDGATYQPQFLANIPSSNYRWSMNPANPTIQYAFPQTNSVDSKSVNDEGTVTTLPQPGPSDDKIVRYDVKTGQVLNTITLPFNKLFNERATIAYVNGHEYVALFGVDKVNPSATGVSVYVVQLDAPNGQNPIIASKLLTTADSGTPEPAFAKALDFSALFFSPDGQHILTLYNGSTPSVRSWRLLDVDYGTKTISPHVIPDLVGDNAFQTNGNRLQGQMPVNWSHPVFAFGPNGSDVYIVGVSGQYNTRTFSQNEITTANGKVGSVLAFNVTNNTFKSLTDPTNENLATHITATNTQHSSYVFVSYWNDTNRGPKYSGELVAINLDNPFGVNGTIELAHHRTNIANHFYHGYSFPTVSPDGKKLIFSSTWGPQQAIVQTFVLDLVGIVP